MSKLWTIPAATIYIYALTILTQYGATSYFNIPANFISISPTENTIYAYNLFKLALEFIPLIKWWEWVIVVIVFCFALFYFRILGKILISTITILLILFLYNAVNFGEFLAENQTNFLTLSPECSSLGKGETYIIPVIDNGKAILIPIDENSKKIGNSFLVKDVAELSCKLEHREIGKLRKEDTK